MKVCFLVGQETWLISSLVSEIYVDIFDMVNFSLKNRPFGLVL